MELQRNLNPFFAGHFNNHFFDYWKKSSYYRCGPTKDQDQQLMVNKNAFPDEDGDIPIHIQKIIGNSKISSTPIINDQKNMEIVPKTEPPTPPIRFFKDIKLNQRVTQNGHHFSNLEIHEDSYWSTLEKEEETQPPQSILKSSSIPPISGPNTYPIPKTRQYLLERGSQLANLVIGEFQRLHLDPTDQIYLPVLKTISWHAPIKTDDDFDHENDKNAHVQKRHSIHKILLASPNLQVIKDFQFDTDFDLVLSTKKVHTVHRLFLFYDTVNVDHLLEFVEAKPKLQILQLIDTYNQIPPTDIHHQNSADTEAEKNRREKMAKAIKKLFHSTSDTLRLLDLSQFCAHFVDLQIPHKLPKLHQLTLGSVMVKEDDSLLTTNKNYWRPQPSRLFPAHIKLNKIFPFLVVLDCSRLESDEISNWDKYFPADYKHEFYGQLTSVKVLVVNDQCTHYWLAKLGTVLCPNFVKLVVHSCHPAPDAQGGEGGKRVYGHLNYMLFKIFKYLHHLEHVELRIGDFPLMMAKTSNCLDPAFTGLSTESCQRLRVFGPAADPDDEIMMIMALGERTAQEEVGHLPGPSISNLKYLKTLTIKLGHNCLQKLAHYTADEDNPMPLFSFVSGRYGFGYLPELKVDIVFDHHCPWGKEILKKKFNLLIPYVTLRHEDDRACDHDEDH